MRRIAMRRVVLAWGAAVLLLSGCSSPEPRFYVLSGVPAPTRQIPGRGQDIAVGVGPVEFPDYLDRPQIVTRTGQNELQIADFDRWAEPLKHNATQVLAENLAVLLPSKKVVTYPWRRATPVDYQLIVKVIRFDRAEGGDSTLSTRWAVMTGDGKSELLNRESRYTERPAGASYGATVAAMNQTLARFSRDVAVAVKGLPR